MSDLHPLDWPGILDCDPSSWPPLQIEICMAVANAPFCAFEKVCEYAAHLCRSGLLTMRAAVDRLQETARYSRLCAWRGGDKIAVQFEDHILQ